MVLDERGACVTADHDMIYLEPFKGTKEVRKYFDKVTSIVPGDLKFCVEDITDGDPRKVGVKWCGAIATRLFQLQENARHRCILCCIGSSAESVSVGSLLDTEEGAAGMSS